MSVITAVHGDSNFRNISAICNTQIARFFLKLQGFKDSDKSPMKTSMPQVMSTEKKVYPVDASIYLRKNDEYLVILRTKTY